MSAVATPTSTNRNPIYGGSRMAAPRICYVDACDKPGKNAGLCHMHYARLRRHGDVSYCQHRIAHDWIEQHAQHIGDECLIYPFRRNPQGYGVLYDPFKRRGTILASRYMAFVALGEPPTPDHYACHNCHNGAGGCVNPKHIYWGTTRENQMDRVEAGNSNRGSRHGHAKLTEDDVKKIRSLRRESVHVHDIAARFNLSVSGTYAILNGSTWSWLK